MTEKRACAECSKPERRWRRMMAKPLGGSVWAYVCSERCWDALDVRRGRSPLGGSSAQGQQ